MGAPGHAGVAIQSPDGWLLNAGDAYLHRGELDHHPHMPIGLKIYERIMITDVSAAQTNLARIRNLYLSHHAEIDIFCSHDSAELEAFRLGEN